MISAKIRVLLRMGCLVTVISSVYGTAAVAAEDNAPQTKEALSDLQASDSAWQENDRIFRTMRQENSSSAVDVEEFAGFVALLRRQMLEDCQRFRDLGGEPIRYGLDCGLEPGESPALAAAIPDATNTQTEQEKFESLENELRAVEIELDNLFLRKREELQSRSRPAAASGAITADPGSGAGARGSEAGARAAAADPRKQGTGAEAGLSGPPAAAASSGRKISERGAGTAGKDRVESYGKLADSPSDIPTGDDDDVLARQLREAAEKESDPLLRKKLWDEYQKYKSAMK